MTLIDVAIPDLAWLDDRRRTNSAVLKELGDITVASQAIMRVAGVGANPITLAGLAFGLAANTFTNVNSRLLLEVDKTTVQTLVLRRREAYRLQLQGIVVDNRPAAIHALRSYLSICTPYTIETDINSTITVFQQVGAGGLVTKPPLVSAATVGAPVGAPVRATERITGRFGRRSRSIRNLRKFWTLTTLRRTASASSRRCKERCVCPRTRLVSLALPPRH